MIAKAFRGKRVSGVDAKVVIGDAYQRIIVATRGMDAVVMSTSGRTGLSHLLIGSVAEKVVRHSPIPVITLRGSGGPTGGAARRKARLTRGRMLRLVFALAIGTWLGAIVSLTYIVTPTAHGAFAPRDARRLLRPLFPRHYALGIVCGFLALGTILVGKESLPHDEVLRLALPTAIGLLCTRRRTPGAAARSARARSRGPALRPPASGVGDAQLDDPRRARARDGRRRHPLIERRARPRARPGSRASAATPRSTASARQSSYSGATFRVPSGACAILTRTRRTASRRSSPRAAARCRGHVV